MAGMPRNYYVDSMTREIVWPDGTRQPEAAMAWHYNWFRNRAPATPNDPRLFDLETLEGLDRMLRWVLDELWKLRTSR